MPATPPSADHILRRLASSDSEIKFKAIREVKNQIIGNRTRKLSYIKLGVVPALVTALAQPDATSALIVQSVVALGSFACGLDAGVRAVLDAGAYPHLIRLVSAADYKVVDAAARSLRMIYQSKLAPKYDFEQDMQFLLSLLESRNENLTGLAASIVIHSCKIRDEQKVLCRTGALEKLIRLFDGSLSQRHSSLESLAAILKDNQEVVYEFVNIQNGRALSSLIELTKDRYSRTRLLACLCLICVTNSSCYLQDLGIKTKLIDVLLELLDDSGQVGDDASFAFSSLVEEKEDLQKLAFEANAIEKFYDHLQNHGLRPKRLEGIFLALSHLCSKLECCRSKFASFQVVNILVDALTHDDTNVRTAVCICLKSVSRSIKILSSGYFTNERIVAPLVRLLSDPSTCVQASALGAISNILVDFTPLRSTFTRCGGIKELVQLAKSMDSFIRLGAVCALKNMVFHAHKMCKDRIFMELTVSSLASLICDPEPYVQEEALALMCNFVDGSMDCVEYAFAGGGIILDAVQRLLQKTSKTGIGIQGMYLLSNIASGNETHKDTIMQLLFPQAENVPRSFFSQSLRSFDSRLRTSAVWVIVNLTSPASPGAFGRILKLRIVGIVSQIKRMANDPCMDVKLRARQALGQIITFGDS
ncbi:hypothetical protein Fmac_030479 [Flemingia macrophylla]|uniref:Armadillo repeat-containing protein 8 n=1 Tax=Flemingia macrophylla TaxID=520843 RepID=A0ABD1KZB1_9FABA